MNKGILAIILIGFIVPVAGLLWVSNCEKNNTTDCLMEKEYLISDFYWHYNIIRYIAHYGNLPEYVLDNEDGGERGDKLDSKTKRASQSPLYHYLGAGIYKASKTLNLNPILNLHLFSYFLMLLANISFFVLMKRISKIFKLRKGFVYHSTALGVFFPINIFVGLFNQGHTIFYLFMILSFYRYIKFLEEKNLKNAIWLGVMLGICLFSSLAGLPLLPILGLHVLWDYFKKKWREGNLLLIPLIIGGLSGGFVLIRNALLYDELIWGNTIDPSGRSFEVFIYVINGFFGGIYGGYDPIKKVIILTSIFVMGMGAYGFFKINIWRRKLNWIWLSGLLTVILAIQSLCSIDIILSSLSCIGGSMVEGRYLLGVVPGMSILFGVGMGKVFQDKKIIGGVITGVICLLYLWDFMYAFLSF